MNNELSPDPRANTVEAQVASACPRVSPEVKERLLYACAFAAGTRTSTRSLRKWQTAVAVLSILLIGVTVAPLIRPQDREFLPAVLPSSLGNLLPNNDPEPPLIVRVPKPADLDAWQLSKPDTDPLDEQLAQLQHTDPKLRSLTVAELMLGVLKQ